LFSFVSSLLSIRLDRNKKWKDHWSYESYHTNIDITYEKREKNNIMHFTEMRFVQRLFHSLRLLQTLGFLYTLVEHVKTNSFHPHPQDGEGEGFLT